MNFESVFGERQYNLVLYQNEKFFKTDFSSINMRIIRNVLVKNVHKRILYGHFKIWNDHQNHGKLLINVLKKAVFKLTHKKIHQK